MTASDHLGCTRTGSGGYGDLEIRKEQTNISVDAIPRSSTEELNHSGLL